MNIKVEQLILGFLMYGFDRVDLLDVSILIKMYLEKFPESNIENVCDKLTSYIKIIDNRIYLKRKAHKFMFNDRVKKFFKTFNIEKFLSMKIEAINNFSEEEEKTYFGIKEREYLFNLEYMGFIDTKKNMDGSYTKTLSNIARLKLLKEDQNSPTMNFYNEAARVGIDSNFIDEYVLDQDLENFSYYSLNLMDIIQKYNKSHKK